METSNKTIVAFNIGRGGHFNNGGHKTFIGCHNLNELLRINDSGKNWNFIHRENESEIRKLLEKRDLKNLLKHFENCCDNDDFTEFEKRTGLSLGDENYYDQNGNFLISVDDVNKEVGSLDWDGEYDTDYCDYLKDLTKEELLVILKSNAWDSKNLIEDYFNDCCDDISVNWKKFDGDYESLIINYFDNYGQIDIVDYYNKNDEEQ